MSAGLILTAAWAIVAVDPRVVDAQQLASHGETAAARGQYEAVLDDLERAGADGSAALHYDIGTLALQEGELGPAMVHLLAAARRAPGDDDVAHNLARAREARVDRVEASSATALAGGVGGILPPQATRWACAFALVLVGIVVGLRGALGRRVPGAVVVVAAALASVAAGAWGARRAFEQRVVVVVQEDTVARSSPDDQASGFDVHPGLAGERVDATATYARVRLENGLDVWIASSALRAVP